MGRIVRKGPFILILAIVLIDLAVGCFLLRDRSFVRLAMWNIIESDNRGDFYWRVEEPPAFFYFEPNTNKLDAFREEISPIVGNNTDELSRALKIAEYVMNIAPAREALSGRLKWDSPTGMLSQIRGGKTGAHCFHHSILYSTYLASVGIKSRLWALEGDDGPGGKSHTVAEVYLKDPDKWAMIDISHRLYFMKDDILLSVFELRDELLRNNSSTVSALDIPDGGKKDNKRIHPYRGLMRSLFLRSANDFENKYDAKIRYGILSKFHGPLDLLPSVYRRGMDYLFGRRDFLIHYVDDFNGSLKFKIIAAKASFYFFIISLFPLAFLLGIFLRKTPATDKG